MNKVVKKMFFVWNEDEEKKFLEDMALEGWKLVRVGLGRYEFESDEPRKVSFQFDFKGIDKIEEADYLQIYEDAGWELSYRFGSWYYFLHELGEEELDVSIFNDNASKKEKYKRILIFLGIAGFPMYYQALFLFPTLAANGELSYPSFYFFFRIFLYVMVGLHVFAVVKVLQMYRKFRNKIQE
jgi:hypothetical protein